MSIAGFIERVVDGDDQATEFVQLDGKSHQIASKVVRERVECHRIGTHRLEAGESDETNSKLPGHGAQDVPAANQPALHNDLSQRPGLISRGVRLLLEVIARHQSSVDEQFAKLALHSVHSSSSTTCWLRFVMQ